MKEIKKFTSRFLIIIPKPSLASNTTLNCLFEFHDENYACLVQDNEIFTTYRISIDDVDGIHENNMANSNVTALIIDGIKNFTFIPKNIENFFSHLISLQITNTSLKRVDPSHLQPFTSLQFLDLQHNNLHVLEENVFKYTWKIQELKLNNNSIFHIEPRTFNYLKDLSFIDLTGNECEKSFTPARIKKEIENLVSDIDHGMCVSKNDEKVSKLSVNMAICVTLILISAVTAAVAFVLFVITMVCVKSELAKGAGVDGRAGKVKAKMNLYP
jgi:hypothetical protein